MRRVKSAVLKKSEPERSPFLIFLYALTAFVCIYCFSVVATVDQAVKPFALPIAVALGVIVLLLGLASADQSQKGYLALVFAVLPATYAWTAATAARRLVASVVLIAASALIYFYGPLSIRTYSVACDAAAKVRLDPDAPSETCGGALTKDIWLSPWRSGRDISLDCYDARGARWSGQLGADNAGACGARPVDAVYATNGIDLPAVAVDTVAGRRTLDGIRRLRDALAQGENAVPKRDFNDRLLVATWNIRELGGEGRGHGARTDESYAYIAEVVSHFDLVAIQEVNDRSGVDKVLSFLGGNYAFELGFTAPGRAGNRESQGFLYDARKVRLGEVSSTLVIDAGDLALPAKTGQPARPPFIAEFKIGKNSFLAASTHVWYGSDTGEGKERRLLELCAMARGVRQSVMSAYPDRLSILAGDLNTPDPTGKEFEILVEQGFFSDPGLAALPSNYRLTRTYDQILIAEEQAGNFPFGRVGVFPIFDHVYRDGDRDDYKIDVALASGAPAEAGKNFDMYRTFQMSDHYPKWAEFRFPPALTEVHFEPIEKGCAESIIP